MGDHQMLALRSQTRVREGRDNVSSNPIQSREHGHTASSMGNLIIEGKSEADSTHSLSVANLLPDSILYLKVV